MKGRVDTYLIQEVVLYTVNTGQLYTRMSRPIILNLARKKVQGTYNATLAIKLYEQLVKEGIAGYNREFGSAIRLNPEERRIAAKELRDYYIEEINEKAREMKVLKSAGRPWAMRG